MVKKVQKSSTAKKSPVQLSGTVKDSAQQIWLAGLGAFTKAQNEGGKVFETLVKKGLSIQRKTQAAAEERITEATSKMATMATGVAERTEHKMHLFPNPTTGHFTVALEGQELALLRLFSTDGRLAVQQRLTGTRVELALAGLAPGAYRAEVRTADGAVYQRSVLVQ